VPNLDPPRRERLLGRLADPRAWLVVTLLLAACSYFYRLGSLAFTTDEIYHGIAVKAILRTGLPVLPNGSLYLKGGLFSYLGALPSLVTGSFELGVRSVSASCVLLTGLLLFLLTTRVTGDRRAGVVAAFVWLFHPWAVEFARWGRLYTLAALLIVAAVYFLISFDVTKRPLWGWLAVAALAGATTVYPFFLWCWVVFAGYGLSLWAQRRPEHAGKVAALAAGFSALAIAAAWLLYAHGNRISEWLTQRGVPLTMFVGSTGHSGAVLVEQFVGFSPAYPLFFFKDLTLFGVSLVALLIWTLVRPEPGLARRASLAFLAIALGGLTLISFVHLQAGTPRYLFPIFPIAVVGSVCLWERLLRLRGWGRYDASYAALLGLCAVGFLASRSLAPVVRDYGDAYVNPNFGPSPLLTSYSNYRAPVDFVAARRQSGDVVATNRYQFYFFYADQEPDVFLRPSGTSRRMLAPYMKKTQVLRCDAFERTLRRKRTGSVWLAVTADSTLDPCLRRLLRKHRFELVYQDPLDSTARVYQLKARSPG
jgi:4-amino-4-deoxy-L-arabinose transferase-like glycosyltransferase